MIASRLQHSYTFRMKVFLVLISLFAGLLAHADIKIVAAENFYGGVAKQIGGDEVSVTSILTNPNQDPHEFTSDAATAKAVADADIVIYNGLGYDGWMDKLLGVAGKKGRIVIRVEDLIGAKDGDNPHIWYWPSTMPLLAQRLWLALEKSLPEEAQGPVLKRLQAFLESMKPVFHETTVIESKYEGTTVTATEPVFGYMAKALGFKMLNYDFQVNIMNDTEPSAAQTAAFEKSLNPKTVKLLFYNKQVTDPTTERLKKLAIAADVPIVGVTETQPADAKNYADWMLSELHAVEKALKYPAGGYPGQLLDTP
jgi:zinc/manganese transport system substrate-binding protein